MIIARRAPVGIALGRRHLGDDGFQDVVNAHAGLGRAGNGIGASMPITSSISALALSGSALGRSILLSTGTTSTPRSSAV
jgi:hypothetical protein